MILKFMVEIADDNESNVEYLRHLLGSRAHHCKVVDVRYLRNETLFTEKTADGIEYDAWTHGLMEL